MNSSNTNSSSAAQLQIANCKLQIPSIQNPQSKIQNGFTLAELLVVIAIIAVLISLLLPAASRARRVTDALVCTSHLRQIGVAAMLYASDYDGVVLPCQVWIKADWWPDHLVRLGYLSKPRSSGGPPFDSGSVFICPSATESLGSAPAGQTVGVDGTDCTFTTAGCSYGINGSNGNMVGLFQPQPSWSTNYSTGLPPVKISRVRFPAQMALIYDGITYLPASNPLYRIAGRHGNRDYRRPGTTGVVNILFVDGHAAGVSRSEIFQSGTEYSPSILNLKYPSVRWRLDQ